MISVNLIERTLEARDFDRLLRDLADNGLPLPLTLRLQLAESEVAATALSLHRLAELTYGPTALVRRLVGRVLESLEADGTCHADGRRDLLCTVLALAALGRVVEEHPAQDYGPVAEALDRGHAALAELQDCDGLLTAAADRTLADRALTTAFVVYLLGEDARFRRSIRLFEIHRWFEERDGRLDRATRQLWDLASVSVEDVPVPTPIAA